MSKEHMGSSIDAFLKKEGIFEEAQAQAIKEVVAWQLAEAMKRRNLEEQDGDVAEDEPHSGGPAARSEERHHARKPAEGGGDSRSSREHRAGVIGATNVNDIIKKLSPAQRKKVE